MAGSTRKKFVAAIATLTATIALALASGGSAAEARAASAAASSLVRIPSSGALRVLTYNVAGLPQGISNVNSSVNVPLIGALLNAYDLVLVQEDFAYPTQLRAGARHRHVSPPFVRGERLDFGDGLSQFTNLPFDDYVREAWSECNGVLDSYYDCLTPKGFTRSRLALGDGHFVHVYNLHMDAGPSALDRRARAKQIEQLVRAIQLHSSGQALLVAGDTNLTAGEGHLLDELRKELGLEDVCRKLRCRDPWRIDRVLLRSSTRLELRPTSWRVDPRFIDARQRPLSDHLAVAVEVRWTVRPDS